MKPCLSIMPIVLAIFLSTFTICIAQDRKSTADHSLFKRLDPAEVSDAHARIVPEADFFELNREILDDLVSFRVKDLTLERLSGRETFEVEIFQLVHDDFKVETSDGVFKFNPDEHLSFKGGDASTGNKILINVFEGELSVFILEEGDVFTIQHVQDEVYVGYYETDLPKQDEPFACGVDPDFALKAPPATGKSFRSPGGSDGCLLVFFEVDFETFNVFHGSVSSVLSWVFQNFSLVKLIYEGADIPISVSGVYIWAKEDIYKGLDTGSEHLNRFREHRRSGFNGHIAHLLTTKRTDVGGIAYVDILENKAFAHGASYRLDPLIANRSGIIGNARVIAHEIGHNIGSRHTHDCVWNGNNTPIDHCAQIRFPNREWNACHFENGLTVPSPGTIMSYCSFTNQSGMAALSFDRQPQELMYRKFHEAGFSGCETNVMIMAQYDEEPVIKLFPNPARVNFTLTMSMIDPLENYSFELVDVFGRTLASYSPGFLGKSNLLVDLVKEHEINEGGTFRFYDYEWRFSTSSLSPGQYFLRISSQRFQTVKKVLITQ